MKKILDYRQFGKMRLQQHRTKIISKIKLEYFIGNAGDIENIISRAKIINSRLNFCKENDYILTKEIIDKSFEKFYFTRINKTDKIPSMMYT